MTVRGVHLDAGPSCRDHRKQENLKIGACISAVFSQIFHRNRGLGSPRSHLPDCLEIAADNSKENEIWLRTVNVSLKDIRDELQAGSCAAAGVPKIVCVADSEIIRNGGDLSGGFSQELRYLLGAKQEPFVLQDVIREKRQPVRIKSSHGLKDPSSKEEKRRTRKRSNSGKGSSDGIKVSDAEQNHATPDLQRRSHAPPERMVAVPSSEQVYAYVARLKKNSASSASKNVGKRALLMEAAAKILEGGGNRSRRQPTASVRSLFSELDGGKNAYGETSRKKTTAIDSQTELAETKTKKKRRKKDDGQIKTEGASLFRSSSVKINNSGIGESEGRAAGELEKIEAAKGCHLLSRVFMSGGNEAVCGSEEKVADMAMRKGKGTGMAMKNHGAMESPEFLRRRRERANSSSSTELYLASSGDSRRNSTSSSSITSSTPMSLSAQASPEHFQIRKLDSSATTIDDSSPSSSSSSSVQIPAILQERLVQAHSSSAFHDTYVPCSSSASADRITTPLICSPAQEAEIRRNSIDLTALNNIQRLCDFSWWEHQDLRSQGEDASAEIHNDEQRGQEEREDADCEEFASPTVIRGSLSRSLYEDGRSSDTQIELTPSATNRPAMEELKQSSPVSVLDPVCDDEEEESDNGDLLDSFEEAKQNLLENVRRFEMLAQMDLDTLMKLAEEQDESDVEEESSEKIYKQDSGNSLDDADSNTHVCSSEADDSHKEATSSSYGTEMDQSGDGNGNGNGYTGRSSSISSNRDTVNLQILELTKKFSERARSSCHDDSSCRQVKALRIYRWPAVPAEVMLELGSPTVSSWLSAIDCKLYSEWGAAISPRKQWDEYSAEVRDWAADIEVSLLASLVQEMVTEMMVAV